MQRVPARTGFFLVPGASLNTSLPQDRCESCLDNAGDPTTVCPKGTTLQTIRLPDKTWRLSNRSRVVSQCPQSTDGVSPCVGGSEAGVAGEGYCRSNHSGPLCKVCDAADNTQYFDPDVALCQDCPSTGTRVGVALAAVVVIGGMIGAMALLIALRPSRVRRLGSCVQQSHTVITQYALLPKFKVAIALYQAVSAIPLVYEVTLPPEYYQWMRVINWIDFDWDNFFVPGSCLPGGYLSRLLLRGLVPLGIMLAVLPLRIGYEVVKRLYRPGSTCTLQSLLYDAIPIMLFIALCFCASVSASIFQAWSCASFEVRSTYDSTAKLVTSETRSFLRSDLTVACDSSTDARYKEIRSAAIALVLIWPVAIPLTFLLILLPIRRQLAHSRTRNQLVEATGIIHREYRVYWWESMYLAQRLIVIGFVQWIPSRYGIIKLQFGLVVTFVYMTTLAILKPYKRPHLNLLAIGAQVTLLVFFIGALNIRLHEDLKDADPGEGKLATRITGFASGVKLAAVIFCFNMLTIVICFASLVYQLREERAQLEHEARNAKARRLHYVESGREVMAPAIATGGFHLLYARRLFQPPPPRRLSLASPSHASSMPHCRCISM